LALEAKSLALALTPLALALEFVALTPSLHLDPLQTRCQCWPASTANQIGLVSGDLDLLTLKVVSESRVNVGYLCQFWFS